jgi:hypothetical protein
VKYDIVDDIITNRDYWFHKQQVVHPRVLRCMHGKCNKYLCHQLDEQFMLAADAYIPRDNKKELVIGKLVKISEPGFVSFLDPDRDHHELNLKWKRLRCMAMPIVDFQLVKIAIDGNWKTKPI